MRNLPVNWSNGMFLRPHHFQAAERFWHELIDTSERWDHAYNYGLRAIQYSEDALGNYAVEVGACQARLRDGTLVSFDVGAEPDRITLDKRGAISLAAELEPAFESKTAVTVYLGVPKLSLGRPNLAIDGKTDGYRYRQTDLSVPDENAGGDDQEISYKSSNVRLLLEGDDLGGYELLPIGRIKRVGEGEAAPSVDDSYIPPLLATDAWPPLSRGIIRAIYDMIGERLRTLGEQVRMRGMQAVAHDPQNLKSVLLLSQLNEAYAILRCLTFAKGIHPFQAYSELCRIVGGLSVFGETRTIDDFPVYDHDDLAMVFGWIKPRIQELIGGDEYIFEQRPFVGTGMGRMEVNLDARWLGENWSWYVGVHPRNVDERQCRELLRPGKLQWKMGSAEQINLVFENNMSGVELEYMPHVPSALPGDSGYVYYAVKRQGPFWQDVFLKRTLALRFTTNLIKNRDELTGAKELVIVADGYPQAVLRFTLFAVPRPAGGS
jgi:type VI secretion system protein ImpJ